MNYYAINLKLAGKDPRTGKRCEEYQKMLIADDQGLTEAFIKNRARELYDGMWAQKIINKIPFVLNGIFIYKSDRSLLRLPYMRYQLINIFIYGVVAISAHPYTHRVKLIQSSLCRLTDSS